MMHTNTIKKQGFTLIELLVVVSIIGLLSSLVTVFTSKAKAKAIDVATVAQVRQMETAFQSSLNTTNTFPNPGSADTYYCLGKTSSQPCTFWGRTYYGSDTVTTSLISSGLARVPISKPIVVDNLVYDGYVYKCKTIINGQCTPAIYWVQSSDTPCTRGIEVVSGVGGRVCGEDAGGGEVVNIELAPLPPPPPPADTPPDYCSYGSYDYTYGDYNYGSYDCYGNTNYGNYGY